MAFLALGIVSINHWALGGIIKSPSLFIKEKCVVNSHANYVFEEKYHSEWL